ncbi:MAG: hypothetical protein JRF33_10010 [Deltaproteobacteria bacterium]|nr:hypothetical protein [Deltaproteobacteria bacterium]
MKMFCPACGTDQSRPASEIPGDEKIECEKCGFRFKASMKQGDSKIPAAGSVPKTRWSGRLPWPGSGRSGPVFRFRDLFAALQAPLDIRKTMVSAVGIFVGLLLLGLMTWLGSLTRSAVGGTIGTIIGLLIFWACTFLGVGLATRLVDLEMRTGKRQPFSLGLNFLKKRLSLVLGTPFMFLAGIVVLGAGMAILALLARIPYAGPIIYGFSFVLTLLLALAAVLMSLLLLLTTFSYIPAAGDDDCGPIMAVRRVGRLFTAKPGWYLLNWLVAILASVFLLYLFGQLFDKAFFFIEWIGGKLGGGEVSRVFLSMPGALFALVILFMPSLAGHLSVASSGGWQFDLAGWLVLLSVMLAVSMVLGFVMTYLSAAGVVNHHLLEQKIKAKPKRE